MIDALLKKFCRWNRYRAWSDGSLWLSLDRFERFWPDVGLVLENGEAVKSVVREALRTKYAMDAEYRARVAINPSAPVDMVYRNRIQTLPKGCITNMAENAGMQDAECIARWILGPVHKAVKWPAGSRVWSAMFYHLSKVEPDMLVSRYKANDEGARRLITIATRHRSEIDALKERLEAADREPLSGWDAIAYADYRRQTPEASPLIGVRLYLTSVGLARAWDEVVASTTRADVDAFSGWTREFCRAHEEQIPDYAAIIPDDVRGPW